MFCSPPLPGRCCAYSFSHAMKLSNHRILCDFRNYWSYIRLQHFHIQQSYFYDNYCIWMKILPYIYTCWPTCSHEEHTNSTQNGCKVHLWFSCGEVTVVTPMPPSWSAGAADHDKYVLSSSGYKIKQTCILDMNVDTLGLEGQKVKQLKMEKTREQETPEIDSLGLSTKKELWGLAGVSKRSTGKV